jgi:indolepyruvate ferredoxin oxidoreductase alpha subunit
MSSHTERLLLSGNEAVARAALDAGVALGVGYPGTPSSEILEALADIGGRAQWSPNEKVAYEVALGVAFARTRALVTMKHVGLNVAADPLFTSAYTGVDGALVVVSADDPGMASSQNEQDNRRYAVAAGLPILEPADSQEAYDYFLKAVEISERWNLPVILRMTTRICHSKTVVRTRQVEPPPEPAFQRDVKSHVMIPAYARPAHRRLREKLSRIAAWNEQSDLNTVHEPLDGNGDGLGIVTSGVSFVHAREATPQAKILKLGMAHPFPAVAARRFAAGVERLLVVEEGDPYLVEQLRVAGIEAEGKPEMYRFGELNVGRVRRIVARDDSPEPTPPRGKPPALCQGCPHRMVFETLSRLDCIVTGDIGCYTLGVLPPFEAIDTCVCMGAAVGVGLGLRHVLPDEPGKRVVSVIGDSTFVHSGITGLVEMLYNPPANGHLLLILDNGTTAMTGLQEHPGTGRTLDHRPTNRLVFEDLATALGVDRVKVFDPAEGQEAFEAVVREALDAEELSVIIVRRPCVLAAGKIKQYEKAIAAGGGNHE